MAAPNHAPVRYPRSSRWHKSVTSGSASAPAEVGLLLFGQDLATVGGIDWIAEDGPHRPIQLSALAFLLFRMLFGFLEVC